MRINSMRCKITTNARIYKAWQSVTMTSPAVLVSLFHHHAYAGTRTHTHTRMQGFSNFPLRSQTASRMTTNRVKSINLSPSSHLWLLGDNASLTQHTDSRGGSTLMWKPERKRIIFYKCLIFKKKNQTHSLRAWDWSSVKAISVCQQLQQQSWVCGPRVSPPSFHTNAVGSSRVQFSASSPLQTHHERFVFKCAGKAYKDMNNLAYKDIKNSSLLTNIAVCNIYNNFWFTFKPKSFWSTL